MSTSKRTTEADHNEEARSWSDAAKATTRQLIDGGEFIPRDDKLHLKHIDSEFGGEEGQFSLSNITLLTFSNFRTARLTVI